MHKVRLGIQAFLADSRAWDLERKLGEAWVRMARGSREITTPSELRTNASLISIGSPKNMQRTREIVSRVSRCSF